MKYYCKSCKTELITPYTENYAELCPHCVTDDGTHKIMERIPDYETPVQYEARTEKPYPDNGSVWVKIDRCWFIDVYDEAKERMRKFPKVYLAIVIASPPVPPPDDFVPEEGGKQ